MTQTGTVLGTSNYIAPEQASGQRVDTQSDVYALGVVRLRDARRRGSVPRRELRRGGDEARPRAAAESARRPSRRAGSRRRGRRPRAGEGSGAAVRIDGRVRLGARGVPRRARRPGGRRGPDDGHPGTPAARGTRKQVSRWPIFIGLLALLAVAAIVVGLLIIAGGNDEQERAEPIGLIGVGSYDPEGDQSEHSERGETGDRRKPSHVLDDRALRLASRRAASGSSSTPVSPSKLRRCESRRTRPAIRRRSAPEQPERRLHRRIASSDRRRDDDVRGRSKGTRALLRRLDLTPARWSRRRARQRSTRVRLGTVPSTRASRGARGVRAPGRSAAAAALRTECRRPRRASRRRSSP